MTDFIMEYQASFKTFASFPIFHKFVLPNTCSSDENIKLETQSILCKLYKKEELPEKWINGDFDNIDISFVHEMYRFGNKKHSEISHKQIMEDSYSKFDSIFKSIVTDLNSYFSQRLKIRCLKEIKTKETLTDDEFFPTSSSKSYCLTHLVQNMFEMYSYGQSYIPSDNKQCNMTDFIMEYQASFKTFASFPIFHKFVLPNTCSSDENIKLETQSILCKLYKKEELPEKWINGDFDNIDISFVHEMYRFGNKKHSEISHKQIMEDSYSKFDSIFKSIVTDLNSYFSQRLKIRCLKEIKTKETLTDDEFFPTSSSKSYCLTHLVQNMFEMYSYGFTEGKFHLPTPAAYMSYLRILVVNMTCKVQNEINNGNENLNPIFLSHGSITDE